MGYIRYIYQIAYSHLPNSDDESSLFYIVCIYIYIYIYIYTTAVAIPIDVPRPTPPPAAVWTKMGDLLLNQVYP